MVRLADRSHSRSFQSYVSDRIEVDPHQSSIRIKTNTAAGAALVSSSPRRRHQKRDRCEGVSRRISQICGSSRTCPRVQPHGGSRRRRGSNNEPNRCGSNQSYELRVSTPTPGSRTGPAQPKTRAGSNLTPGCITYQPARASLCASALRARIVLVFAALRS